jgi:hypothetical protein
VAKLRVKVIAPLVHGPLLMVMLIDRLSVMVSLPVGLQLLQLNLQRQQHLSLRKAVLPLPMLKGAGRQVLEVHDLVLQIPLAGPLA